RQDIRVDLDKLDSLINLIGEMVIAENMVIHNPDLLGLELENFNKAGQHLIKIVRELQEMAMTIRMIPVSGLFRRMMRLVHDLSRKSGKKVDLELIGETTEMDKTVIEKITDPLVHLIRNSMDHGIEDPEGRKQADKSETGLITLSASHEEGNVLITIVDDGQGLAKDKILAKAIDRGLLEDDGSHMSDKEVFNLIFLPGFSTAEKVTDVSGRGVGMDVVRQNLEAIKGKVEIVSTEGKGTTIILRIPLTLAIIDGMLVRTGKSHYIVPILSIRESFQPETDAITVSPDGQELVRVRENLLPIVRLHELHNVTPDTRELEKGILIVLEAGEEKTCLFVDELMGQQQTVIKGLSNYISKTNNIRGVSGCTILGNGEVCLIIDVRSLRDFTESLQTG
ncbi:MAG: chemotaxis protein CheA, partial [Desulfobulbaceae bacterium]|nr:chemotaxis protein CheA [Desulfobulbaceae bacterium]